MSSAYTAGGKRRSSMTHARRGHPCGLCGNTVYGNGWQVAHGRGHVHRKEAVELVKHYQTDPSSVSRLFLAPDDPKVQKLLAEGYTTVG